MEKGSGSNNLSTAKRPRARGALALDGMDIYFSGSISGGREDVGLYQRIVAFLADQGHVVISGEVANPAIRHEGERLDPTAIFERDLGWIRQVSQAGGMIVAEVSRPSLGVGYELAAARYLFDMPVVCLWRPAYSRRCSAMISGDSGIELIEYEAGGEQAMMLALGEAVERRVEKPVAERKRD